MMLYTEKCGGGGMVVLRDGECVLIGYQMVPGYCYVILSRQSCKGKGKHKEGPQ